MVRNDFRFMDNLRDFVNNYNVCILFSKRLHLTGLFKTKRKNFHENGMNNQILQKSKTKHYAIESNLSKILPSASPGPGRSKSYI